GALIRDTYIERGIAYAAAQFLAMYDMSGNGIGMAKQVLGALQVAYSQGGAQFGAGNAVAVPVCYIGNGFDLKAKAMAGAAQQFYVATALVAIAKVLAYQQPACIQPFHQQTFDKVFGWHVCQRVVEAFNDDLVDLMPGKRGNFVTQAADLGRNEFRTLAATGEVGTRVRFERHDSGRQVVLVGMLADAGQDGPVATMDAVEIAYCDGAGPLAVVARKAAVKGWSVF